MTFEVFNQGPAVYIPILLFSLIFTVFAYGVFPIIFAYARKAQITEKKYKKLCYLINVPVVLVFFIFGDGDSNLFPYFLWTFCISKLGTKILKTRGIIPNGNHFPYDINSVSVSKPSENSAYNAYSNKNPFNAYPNCDNHKNRHIYLNTEPKFDDDKIRFCRICGDKLFEGSRFCRKCGTEVVKVDTKKPQWRGYMR